MSILNSIKSYPVYPTTVKLTRFLGEGYAHQVGLSLSAYYIAYPPGGSADAKRRTVPGGQAEWLPIQLV